METIKQFLITWWTQFDCYHEWEFDGIDMDTKEGYWYWHYEKCDHCEKRRNTLNFNHCPCHFDRNHA